MRLLVIKSLAPISFCFVLVFFFSGLKGKEICLTAIRYYEHYSIIVMDNKGLQYDF